MRRYDIVSGTLLILSIIDFALAAPVLMQEKRQACVDVVHIPKDVITVVGKRGEEDEFEKLWEEYFDHLGYQEESGYLKSPATHSSSSSTSAPPEPDHGSTNIVKAPAPNPSSSTANPDPMWESYKGDNELHWPQYTPTSSGYGSDREFTEAHALGPNDPRPSADSDSSIDSDFDWNYWMNSKDSPQSGPASPKEFGQAHEYQVEHSPSPNLGSPKEPEDEVVPRPRPSPDPELHLGHQSLGADSQPVDLQAAIYAAKGKAKESRRISSTTTDVGNVAQRELQPAERSLDPGE